MTVGYIIDFIIDGCVDFIGSLWRFINMHADAIGAIAMIAAAIWGLIQIQNEIKRRKKEDERRKKEDDFRAEDRASDIAKYFVERTIPLTGILYSTFEKKGKQKAKHYNFRSNKTKQIRAFSFW